MKPERPAGADGNPLCYDFDGNGKIDDKDIEKVSSRWPGKIGEDAYVMIPSMIWIMTELHIINLVPRSEKQPERQYVAMTPYRIFHELKNTDES